MKLKIILLIFSFFLPMSFFGQASKVSLPYGKLPKYPKKSTAGLIMAKMVDELGYKYHWVTDSLLNDELQDSFSSRNLPRLLLKGAHQMSENLRNSAVEDRSLRKPIEGEMSFSEYRLMTLLNLQEASNALVLKQEASLFLNWDIFTESIALADAYCNQIIEFRENNGNPYRLKNDFKQKSSARSTFEESIGADGLTNDQWMKIMERGGGPDAWDKIATTRKVNQKIITERRKDKRGIVTVGDLESLESSSSRVDGLVYTYFYDPPGQLSFLFSTDKNLIEGLVNWIIYINSGNPTNLLDMFRVGLDITTKVGSREELLLNQYRYREIVDKEGNKVRLDFSERSLKKSGFSDMLIDRVDVTKNNEIEFYGKSNLNEYNSQKSEQKIFQIKKMEGDLLDRIKKNINQMREGLYEYNDSIMNLPKY